MNLEELERIVWDELRRDAANTPSGGAVRTAVLEAVSGLAVTDRPARRWVVPLLVAAAVVALAIAATLLPRAFDEHSGPARPKPPSLPAAPAPVNAAACGKGQRVVDGTSAKFTDVRGKVGYAYEYYCAEPNGGGRGGSFVETFRMVGGRLVYDHALISSGVQEYVMSMKGTDGGLIIREYDTTPGIAGHPGGVVMDEYLQVDADGANSSSEVVAQPCLAADLTVGIVPAYQPTNHDAMQLTNHSGKACAVWGNPRYVQETRNGPVSSTISVLRGPAGGLGKELSAPPLVLQPGQTASASISSVQVSRCAVLGLYAVLPNGVQLGAPGANACIGSVVSYPLVLAENGSEGRPELTPPASATGSCLRTHLGDLETSSIMRKTGNRGSMTLSLIANGSTTCTITGYPETLMLDENYNLQKFPFPAQTLRGPLGGLTGGRFSQVTVSPGHPATALVEWSENPADGRCDSGGIVQANIGRSSAGGGPLPESVCAVQVHPFVAGSTGNG